LPPPKTASYESRSTTADPGDLNLAAAWLEIADANFGVAGDANKIAIIQLQLGAAIGSDRNRIARQ
jgi:hypothetical protein